MKVFIDANLLIYLNALRDPGPRAVYEGFYLDLLSRYKAYTDVLVLDELIYISRKKYRIPYDLTLDFVESIVLPYVAVLPLGEDEYREAADTVKKYGLKPSDALHIAAMKNSGISRIASEDSDFDKIPWVTRVWTH